MVGNPLSDMLIRIKNGYLAGQKTVEIPYSKLKEELAKILIKEGYLGEVKVEKEKSGRAVKNIELKTLKVSLKYIQRRPAMGEIKVVSKPSLRVYTKKYNIPSVLGGRGLVIISTPKGLMTGRQARKDGLGGEIICKVW